MTVRACISCLDLLLDDKSRTRRAVKGSRSEGKALALDGPRARGTISIQVEAEESSLLQPFQSAASERDLYADKRRELQQLTQTVQNQN
jgi:hypothetical protein